tara:strand:- start:167 stop:268 length:102 start_codon:yes stop_codon:yes gene_type:complete
MIRSLLLPDSKRTKKTKSGKQIKFQDAEYEEID